jgi:Fe-S-cluster containining protein
MQKIVQQLPQLYEQILPEFFREEIPDESLATCENCAMAAPAGQTPLPGVQYYLSDTKCCTYFPKLPSYLVGGLLGDSDTALDEGRRRIRERIAGRIGVTPQGVAPPKKYALLLKHGEPGFGKNRLLVCPYYRKDAGTCTIWKFRDAVCSTYFCKTAAGQEGKKLWNIVKLYLLQSQDALVWYCIHQLKLPIERLWEFLNEFATDSLSAADLDDQPVPGEVYSTLWGDWVGREEEYYKECYRLVGELTPERFESTVGVNQKIYMELLKGCLRNVISPDLPPVLKRNPEMKSFKLPDGRYAVTTVAGFYTIEAALYEALNLFDGVATTRQIAARVEAQYNDTLDESLLIPLYQFRMLVPA